MKQLFKDIDKFIHKTFPEAGSVEHLLKLKQEIEEVIKEPDNIFEYADCLIALFGAVAKAGFDFDDILYASERKIDINKSRTWKKLPDGTHQHIKK